MVKIREYKSRKAADSASSYLMSKGIPAVIKGCSRSKGFRTFKRQHGRVNCARAFIW